MVTKRSGALQSHLSARGGWGGSLPQWNGNPDDFTNSEARQSVTNSGFLKTTADDSGGLRTAETSCSRARSGACTVTRDGPRWPRRRYEIRNSYLVREMRDLRFQPASGAGNGRRASRIAFDYGARTVPFGAGIEEAEAAELIGRMRPRRAHRRSFDSAAGWNQVLAAPVAMEPAFRVLK